MSSINPQKMLIAHLAAGVKRMSRFLLVVRRHDGSTTPQFNSTWRAFGSPYGHFELSPRAAPDSHRFLAEDLVHPVTGRDTHSRPSPSSGGITWARAATVDPCVAVRKDRGKVSLPWLLPAAFSVPRPPALGYQLHYDNLAASLKADPTLESLPYSTVRGT